MSGRPRWRGVITPWLGCIALASAPSAGMLHTAPVSGRPVCTCLPRALPLADLVSLAVEDAEAVFSGRVVRVKETSFEDAQRGVPWDEIRVHVRVTERWKGVSPDTVVVRTSSQSSMCGVDMEEGDGYLIYAWHARSGDFFTHSCSRTALLRRVPRAEWQVLRRLRAAASPIKTDPAPVPR